MLSIIPSSILPKKPSPEEIAEAAPLRQKARQNVLDKVNIYMKNEHLYKNAGLTENDLKPLRSYLETELAWWNANLEVTPTQVNTRATLFQETLPVKQHEVQENLKKLLSKMPTADAQKIIDSFPKDAGFTADLTVLPDTDSLQDIVNNNNIKDTQDAQSIQAAIDNHTVWDDIWSALKWSIIFGLIFAYIYIAFLFAGFAANDILYKPIPYRALSFTYTLLFMPIFFPYYIYREIRSNFYPGEGYKPRFESYFPMTPYDSTISPDNLTFNQKFFGYANTPVIRKWIQTKQDEEKESWLSFLKKPGAVV